jgi:hypothetical protein
MSTPVRLTDAVLVVVDISGYTSFVQQRTVSLEHAEAIVSELIESIIDHADHPLVVNKLEGDAALLYAETRGAREAVAASATRHVSGFFTGFATSLQRIGAERRHCDCDACANIGSLQLKAFMHIGEIVIKRVRTFEEIAGDPVILVHRMTKNAVPLRDYVLMTDAFCAAGGRDIEDLRATRERVDGAEVTLHWCDVDAIGRCAAQLPVASFSAAGPLPAFERSRAFAHQPRADTAWANAGPMAALRQLFSRWRGR